VAYVAKRGPKLVIVVDGVEGPEYDGFLGAPLLVNDGPGLFHALVLRGNDFLRVELRIAEDAGK
jgi:hypothetical protein